MQRKDYRCYNAIMQYVLYKICKKTTLHTEGKDIEFWSNSVETEYIPASFYKVKWIVDKINFYMGKWHGITGVSYEWFFWLNDITFVPETFETDYTADYDPKTNKFINSGKYDHTYKDFLSYAIMKSADKAIFKYRLYGWFTNKIELKFYLLKYKIRDIFS